MKTTMQAICEQSEKRICHIDAAVSVASKTRKPMYVWIYNGWLIGWSHARESCTSDWNYNSATWHPVEGKRSFLLVLPVIQ